MIRTATALLIILSLNAFQLTAQNSSTTLKRAAPEPVMLNNGQENLFTDIKKAVVPEEPKGFKELQERYNEIRAMDLENTDPATKKQLKNELEDMKKELQRDDRRRRPFAKLLLLAGVVVLIIVLV